MNELRTLPRPRLEARLRDPEDLRRAMHFNRVNIRELAEECGNPRYRSTIGHLHSGARKSCGVHLAGRIEKVLRMHSGSLFVLSTVSSDKSDTRQIPPNRRRSAA